MKRPRPSALLIIVPYASPASEIPFLLLGFGGVQRPDEKPNAFCGPDRPLLHQFSEYTRRVSERMVQCLSRSGIAQAWCHLLLPTPGRCEFFHQSILYKISIKKMSIYSLSTQMRTQASRPAFSLQHRLPPSSYSTLSARPRAVSALSCKPGQNPGSAQNTAGSLYLPWASHDVPVLQHIKSGE